MRAALLPFSLFILLGLLFNSCRFSGYSARYVSGDVKNSRPVVFGQDFEKALYSTDLNVFGRQITGITVIKHDSTGFHVAMLSELGLKYFELFFPANDSTADEIRYVMEVMNHKPVTEGLLSLYGLLFQSPVYDSHTRFLMNETGKTCLLINKIEKKQVSFYFSSLSGEVEELTSKKLLKPNAEIKLSGYGDGYPGSLLLFQQKLSIQLKRL